MHCMLEMNGICHCVVRMPVARTPLFDNSVAMVIEVITWVRQQLGMCVVYSCIHNVAIGGHREGCDVVRIPKVSWSEGGSHGPCG